MTAPKQASEPSESDTEVFRALAELSPDIVSIINPDGTLRYNSHAALRIHGYTQEEMTGRNTVDLIHPEDRELVQQAMGKLLERPGNLTNVQYRYLNKDGSYAWMEAVASNQVDNPHIRGFVTISRDITQRKKLEEDLRKALALRDEFISVASHELKTPLTALQLQIQTLSRLNRKPGATDQVQLLIDLAGKSVGRLNLLVRDLLDVGRIRTGQLLLNLSMVDLSETVKNVLAFMSEEIAGSGSSVRLQTAGPVLGCWDRARIEQVVANLLSNAVKYGRGRPIELTVGKDKEKNHAVLTVRDEGEGIPEAMLGTIFNRFERGPSKDRVEGLGLGLFIARQVVAAHGGTIYAQSKIGEGSLFTVRLPL